MKSKDPADSPLSAGDGPPDELQMRLLAEYIDRLNRGESLNLHKIMVDYPELASEVIEQLQAFREIGTGDQFLGTLGEYRLLRLLGRGGMGVVYEAWQHSMDRRVALKVLPGGLLSDLKAVARFEREAKIAGKLQHPNIVSVHGIGVDDNTPHYAMEFVEGETLAQILVRLRAVELEHSQREKTDLLASISQLFGKNGAEKSTLPLDPSSQLSAASGPSSSSRSVLDTGEINLIYCVKVAEAFAGVAEGLQHAHQNGVIHRDLKPSNLILDSGRWPHGGAGATGDNLHGRLRILDFGLARVEGQESLTVSGDFVGTPLYMSPEQARSRKIPVDHRTDIYSLGATLYEMLTLHPPFRGKDHQDTLSQIISRDPQPLRRWNPRIPKDLETIALKCLRKEPSERYRTAEALAQDLRRFARGDPIEARPQPVLEKLVRRCWRDRAKILMTTSLFLLLLAVGLLVLKHRKEAQERMEALYEKKVLNAVLDLEPRKITLNVWTREASKNFSWETVAVMGLEELASETMANAVEKGISELDEAVELVPGRPDANFHRARGLHSLGRVEEALKEVDCALDCDGSFFPAEALKSALLKQTKTSSEIGANGAVSKGPAGGSWGAAWFSANRGVAEGRWEEAAGAYGQLIDLGIGGLEPYLGASVEFRLGRGNARLEMGDVNGAILDFAAARDRWPAALEPAILLGKAWYLKGEKKQAQSAFEEAFGQAKSGDRQNEVAVWISLICARLKDYERSLAWAERLGPGSTRERLRGGALIRLERLKDAEIAHREYIKLDEKSPIAYTGLGLVLWKQAKGKEAIDMYLKALELDPKYLWAHNNLGLALEWEGKTEEALQSFRRALELDSKFKTPLYNIGATLLSRGRYGEAIDAYKSAVGKGLDSAYSLRLLEDALVEKRDYKSAVGEGPDSAYSLRLLGDALFAKRDVEAAIETYKKSLALRPDPTTLNSLGIALERKGALKDAFAAFCDALEMNPRGNNPYVHLSRFLRQRDPSVFAEQLVRLKKNLEKVLSSEQEPPSFPELLQSLALALSRDTRRDDDLTEAFRYARLALEKTRRKDARPLATLARLQFTRGDKERAVLTLERASQLPHWEWSHQEELERYRKELLPHLASFASIDGALSSLDRELLVPGGASWRFFRGREEPPAAWMSPEFDDSTWESGPSGFGHGKYEAATLLNDMRGSYSSVYLRRTFSIEDSSQFEDFILRVRSDTGFIVYINGKEVARAGIGGEKTRIPFDGIANHDMVWHQPVYEFRSDPELFHAGRNVMAIQGLSASLESPDFLLLPVLDGQARCDRSRDGQLIQGLGPKGNNAAVHIAYLEGRLFDRAGKHREAAAKFLEVLTLENALPEPYFRLAESLRSEGDCAEARKVLQRAFQRGFGDDKTLWNLWAAISFVDLKLGLEEMLASLPLPAAKGQGAAALETFAEPKGDYARDLLWLLKTLQGEFAIRINCGGGKYRSSTGVPWEEDRFYSGGNLYEGARSVFALGIHGTDDDLLYRTERYFPSNEVTPAAYHFPLPTGSYRITLHFAEIYHKQPGKRCFDVLLEGTRVLKEYEPGSKGFATADEKTFNTEVKDGLLDIEFVPRVENPKISAIEIEPLK